MSAPVPATAATASFWRTLRVILWAFIGIRKDSERAEDFAQLKPVNIIIVGILAAVTLVLLLIGLVNWVIAT